MADLVTASESTDHSNQTRTNLSKPSGNVSKKKSILVTRGEPSLGVVRRGSSKATIQWKEGVKISSEEEEVKRISLSPLTMLMTRGSRWKYIQNVLIKLKFEEAKLAKGDEDMQVIYPKGIESLVRELGSAIVQKRQDKVIELTFEQEDKLEILKSQLKEENDNYLKQHPELEVLLQLIYRKLFKYQPRDPKLFVANYVHHLNSHREELILEELDVPFDRPPQPKLDAVSSTDEERQKITLFARKLVEKIVIIASRGAAYVNVRSIIDSMFNTVVPSEFDVTSIRQSITSAEEAVSEILTSLMTSVAVARTRSIELIVEEILYSILENISHTVKKDSEVYLEVKTSIERFVLTLLNTLTDDAITEIMLREAQNKLEHEIPVEDNVSGNISNITESDSNLSVQQLSKPILKKVTPLPGEDDHGNIDITDEDVEKGIESRVKFQSVKPYE